MFVYLHRCISFDMKGLGLCVPPLVFISCAQCLLTSRLWDICVMLPSEVRHFLSGIFGQISFSPRWSQRSVQSKLRWSVLFPPPKSWLGSWLSTWYSSYICRIELDLLNSLFELLDYWKSVKYCPSKDECGSDDLPMNLLGLGISAHFWLWACFFI